MTKGRACNCRFARPSASLNPKLVLVDSNDLIEEKGPLARHLECGSNATRDDTKGPKDAVESTAVVAGDQARTSYTVRSRTAYFLRRTGIGAPLLSTDRVERADSMRIG